MACGPLIVTERHCLTFYYASFGFGKRFDQSGIGRIFIDVVQCQPYLNPRCQTNV